MEKEEKTKNKHDKDSMFIRVPKRTVFDDKLTKTDITVLNAICSFINSETNSWHMSRPAIAERAKMKDLQTMDKNIKNLEEHGYIQVKRGGLRGEVKSENNYRVIFDENEAKKAIAFYAMKKAEAERQRVLEEILANNPNVVPMDKAKKGKSKLKRVVKKAPADQQEPVKELYKSCISIGGGDPIELKKKSTPSAVNTKSTAGR